MKKKKDNLPRLPIYVFCNSLNQDLTYQNILNSYCTKIIGKICEYIYLYIYLIQ